MSCVGALLPSLEPPSLMNVESQLNGNQDGDRFAEASARRESPCRRCAERLLIETQARVERSQHTQPRAHAGRLHDALDDDGAFDARPHRLDRVLRLFLMNRDGHRHAAAGLIDAVAYIAAAPGSDPGAIPRSRSSAATISNAATIPASMR